VGDDVVDLGAVTAPSGVLVLAMAGQLDYIWAAIGQRLSERAATAAAAGGGHVREWLFEAVAVPAAADRPLSVRATTQPSPFDQQPTIAVLEVDLGVAVPALTKGPIVLGDLPVDPTGMVLGDAVALDSWVGLDGVPRAAWGRPLHVGTIQVAGCQVIGIGWDPGDHSMRHRGGRAYGMVYPVTVFGDGQGGAVMRWTIPPYGTE
jgi:hypothetical protein